MRFRRRPHYRIELISDVEGGPVTAVNVLNDKMGQIAFVRLDGKAISRSSVDLTVTREVLLQSS